MRATCWGSRTDGRAERALANSGLHCANWSKHNGPVSKLLGHDLGGYLREQRQSAQLSLRQLAELAGISNPYLSQIERGLKRPSAQILQQLARGLEVSAESLYVRAGILEPADTDGAAPGTVREVVVADIRLTDRQRAILLDLYESFVGASGEEKSTSDAPTDTGESADVGTTPRRRKPPALAAPTAAALTTRRPQTTRSSGRESSKE